LKRLYTGLAIALIFATAAFAGRQIVLSDYDLEMQLTDNQTVTICMYEVKENSTSEIIGEAVDITNICRDVNENGYCFDGVDIENPGDFSINTNNATTDSDGCTEIEIMTKNATQGTYSYMVNGIGGSLVEVGTANAIPEFSTVSATLALLGGSLAYYKIKKISSSKRR
jgi:hypothetical protein